MQIAFATVYRNKRPALPAATPHQVTTLPRLHHMHPHLAAAAAAAACGSCSGGQRRRRLRQRHLRRQRGTQRRRLPPRANECGAVSGDTRRSPPPSLSRSDGRSRWVVGHVPAGAPSPKTRAPRCWRGRYVTRACGRRAREAAPRRPRGWRAPSGEGRPREVLPLRRCYFLLSWYRGEGCGAVRAVPGIGDGVGSQRPPAADNLSRDRRRSPEGASALIARERRRGWTYLTCVRRAKKSWCLTVRSGVSLRER